MSERRERTIDQSPSRLTLEDLPSAPDPWSRRDQRRSDARGRRTRRRRRVRAVVVLVVALAVIGGGAFAAKGPIVETVGHFTASKDYAGAGTGTVQVTIPSGASGRAIGAVLERRGVVKTAGAFSTAVEASASSGSLQPGTYRLRRHMSAHSALVLLLAPASRLSLKVTIPEGFTAAKTLARLAQATGQPLSAFQSAVKDSAGIGLPAEAGGDAEGYLFPATYDFDPKTTPTQMLAAMVAKGQAVMTAAGLPADPVQRHADLVEASLVQAEAGSTADMGKVARVFDNRLAAGTALQLDTTVNYATGKTGLTTTAADRASTSPYNTYTHVGLPPGPIDAPGQEAMAAVVNPTPGSWQFFVVVDPDTGETLFADTYAEHQQNVAKFQAWLKAHPQQG